MISIVMAYFNRKSLLIRTLQSISKSVIKDIEVIVVDDYSKEAERIEDLQLIFPFLKVVRVESEEKWYVNSCIPFNRGIALAKGNIIVLQNPECIHIGDVLKYIENHITDENYLSISTYAIHRDLMQGIDGYLANFKNLPQQIYKEVGWYNHSVYRPVYYHFCSAITRKNMNILQGFDELYAMGVGYDDDEFVVRIDNLGLKKIIPIEVSVLHQGHPVVLSHRREILLKKNKIIFEILTKKEGCITKSNSYIK